MNEQAQSDRVLARKKREAQALKANIQRRKDQSRAQARADAIHNLAGFSR